MNNVRRKKIKEAKLNIEQIENQLHEVIDIITDVMDEEQDSFDNLSDGLQSTIRGQLMEDNVDFMQEACDCLENLFGELGKALNSLDDVM